MGKEITYPIRLDQYLKLMNMVGSGGEAKMLIVDGLVEVNAEIETRRGRKLNPGDVVKLGEDSSVVGS